MPVCTVYELRNASILEASGVKRRTVRQGEVRCSLRRTLRPICERVVTTTPETNIYRGVRRGKTKSCDFCELFVKEERYRERRRTWMANAKSAASVQWSCFPFGREWVRPAQRASNAMMLKLWSSLGSWSWRYSHSESKKIGCSIMMIGLSGSKSPTVPLMLLVVYHSEA